MMRTITLAVAIVLFLSVRPAVAVAQPAQNIDDLIRRLGSNIFSERDGATKELCLRPEARAALEKAALSKDLEVAARARGVLKELNRIRRDRLFERVRKAAERREIDRLVELMTHRLDDGEDSKCWEAVVELALKLQDLEAREYHRVGSPDAPGVRWSKEAVGKALELGYVIARPKAEVPRKVLPYMLLLRAAEVDCRADLWAAAAVSAGPFRARKLGRSVAFVNADAVIESFLRDSLLISDGDVSAEVIGDSLVIARGTVTARVIGGSTVFSGSGIEIKGNTIKATLISAKAVQYAKPERREETTVQENAPNALSLVKFFEPVDAGVEVEATDGLLRIRKVQTRKSFARAGLREGDLVLAVGGIATDSPLSFRRLLRNHLASDEDFRMRVRRANETIEVIVSCKE